MQLRRLGFAALAALALLGGAPAYPQDAAEQAAPRTVDIASHVAEASQRFGLPEQWIYTVMRTESAGRVTAAPLAQHLTYLKRDGVTRDGKDAELFGADPEPVNGKLFAERCGDDRHHFRFIVSPEDATELADVRTFTRELLTDMEKDLGTRLDWVAVDHWNTDNPHVHVLVRGKADDGRDLVIDRGYIS